MSTFITNSSEKSLRRRLKPLFTQSEELKFLIGFFYLSSIKELYETFKEPKNRGRLKRDHLKIFIELNVDKFLHSIYEYSKTLKFFSEEIAKKEFFNSIKMAFTSQDVDNQDFYIQAKFFIELLEKEKLVLRKTKNLTTPNFIFFKFNKVVRQVFPSFFYYRK